MLINHPKAKVNDSKSASGVFIDFLSGLDDLEVSREHFWTLGLTMRNDITFFDHTFAGASSSATVEPKFVILKALQFPKTASLIVCYNHPSGNLNPSPADKDLTTKLIKAMDLMDLVLLDHLIVSDSNLTAYFSFADHGLL
jgi:DNA repair protein RadC